MTNEMTAKEAVKQIKENCYFASISEKTKQALDMAIKALEAQPKQPCEDCVSREAVNTLIDELARAISDERCFVPRGRETSLIMQDILALPSVTPQASEEDIHREREQAYMLGYEDASKKFRTEPCEDCISRQKALDCFEQTNTRQGAKYAIETLPSVTPQTPEGRWIATENEEMNIDGYFCSCCDLPMETEERTKYCPNCGAKMKAESEEK